MIKCNSATAIHWEDAFLLVKFTWRKPLVIVFIIVQPNNYDMHKYLQYI